jgi:hypothetical protein
MHINSKIQVLAVLSIAAVAFYPELNREFKRFTGALDSERQEAYAENLLKLSIAGAKAAQKEYDSVVLAREMVAYGEELAEQYRQRLALGSDMAKVWLDEIDARKQVIEFEKQIADIKTQTAKTEGKDVSRAPQIAHERAMNELQEEMNRLKKIEAALNSVAAAQKEKQAAMELENNNREIKLENER